MGIFAQILPIFQKCPAHGRFPGGRTNATPPAQKLFPGGWRVFPLCSVGVGPWEPGKSTGEALEPVPGRTRGARTEAKQRKYPAGPARRTSLPRAAE